MFERFVSDSHGTSLILDISPPSQKPVVTEVERMRTSARFDIRSDEDYVDSYVVSAYKVKEPESTRHPISASAIQTIPAEVKIAAGGATQPNIVIGNFLKQTLY